MIYDLDAYRHSVYPLVKIWCDFRPTKKPIDEIGAMAISTECPIVVIAHYVEEMYGSSPELTAFMERLYVFYIVSEVKGKRV